ncbi:MAG: histidine phosphatase family protein [Oscillospiraceae bacterium]|nr:histidine phosphatase family protein [Oscillospiraceae bacterium]
MKVFFVRHGESEANRTKCFTGQSNPALTEAGRAQAEAIRPIFEGISFDKVYSSDLSRAHDTQKLALPGYEAETLEILREINVGNLAGTSITDFIIAHGGVSPTAQTGDYTPYGGENRQMQDARIRQFMDMLEKQPYETVAVFAHKGVLASAIRNVLGFSDLPNPTIKCDNCAVNVLEYDGKKWSILSINYMKKV